MLCPCGSAINFQQCCQRFIGVDEHQALPETAEQLMRSRFSAYALEQANYIYQTYAKETRQTQCLDEIAQWAQQCCFIGLVIHPITQQQSSIELNDNSYDFVEFSAFYIINDTLNEMRERSRFIKEENHFGQVSWHYLDGEILKSEEISKIKRNDPCPCSLYHANSSNKLKKFKHCCKK